MDREMGDGVEGSSRHGDWPKQRRGIMIDSSMF